MNEIKFDKKLNDLVKFMSYELFNNICSKMNLKYLNTEIVTTKDKSIIFNDRYYMRDLQNVIEDWEYISKYYNKVEISNTYWLVQPYDKNYLINYDNVEFLKKVFDQKYRSLL